MKKIISLLIAISMMFSLAGCSGNKPDEMVTAFCNAIQTYDVDAAKSCLENSEVLSFDDVLSFDEDEPDEDEAYIDKYLQCIKDNMAKMTYTLGESKIDGDNATVPVTFTYVNLGDAFTSAMGEYFTQAFAMAFSGIDDEDQLGNLFANIFVEKANSNETDTITADVNFECVKADGEWKISEFSETDKTAIGNVISCNILSVAEDIADGFTDDEEDETVWHDVPLGQETELSTVKIKINSCEEKQELVSDYMGTDVAQEGTKYIVLNVQVENITNNSINFSGDLPLTDGKGRNYETYYDASMYYDEILMYTKLSPGIPKEGVLVYNVPSDSTDCFISVLKDGTSDGYRLYLK